VYLPYRPGLSIVVKPKCHGANIIPETSCQGCFNWPVSSEAISNLHVLRIRSYTDIKPMPDATLRNRRYKDGKVEPLKAKFAIRELSREQRGRNPVQHIRWHVPKRASAITGQTGEQVGGSKPYP
jgi:hypothetical protein